MIAHRLDIADFETDFDTDGRLVLIFGIPIPGSYGLFDAKKLLLQLHSTGSLIALFWAALRF